jgi:hypothetical protein
VIVGTLIGTALVFVTVTACDALVVPVRRAPYVRLVGLRLRLAPICTVTVELELPPGPVQLSVYVFVVGVTEAELSTPVVASPETCFSPAQLPEAVQLVTPLPDQLIVAL